jgi:hypothetical protein
MEYSLFVVPDALPLDGALCPTQRVAGSETSSGPPQKDRYLLATDRRINAPASQCKLEEHCTFCALSADKEGEEGEEACETDCPAGSPSSTLKFQVVQPLGAKYLRQIPVKGTTRYMANPPPDGVGTAFGQQKLQFNYGDVRTDFALGFGPELVAAEETVLAGGDESLKVETGVYRGFSADGTPAPLPRLNAIAQLTLDRDQTQQVAERAVPKGWHLGGALEQILLCADKGTRAAAEASLTSLGCSGEPAFPLDIPLPDIELQPGKITTAIVTVRIVPVYYASAIGRLLRLESWIASVQKVRVESEEHDYDQRTKASLRVRAEIELNTRRMYVSNSFDMYDFCFNLGSWQGLWLFGGTLLSLWVSWMKPWGRVGPMDPMRAREAVSARVENARLEKRTLYLQGRYDKEAVGEETFDQFVARLQRGDMATVDVLQDKYDEEGDAADVDAGGDGQLVAVGDNDKRTMDKTLVEMDEWGEKKLPAVHVAN